MTGPLLMWVAEHEPGTYRAARWALAPKDWLRARLTGEIHAEPSDASASLLYDVPGDRWDLEVVGALGLDAGLLAPLLPSAGAPAGHLTARAADELGLPAGIPVAAGAGDTAAATLGSGIGLGEVQLTIGTGAQVIRPLAGAVSRADAGVHLYRSATPTGWYQMGATLSAGLSLNWVREAMNATWEELYASADRPGRPGRGPIFVPHLSGERTPYCDPALRGSWTGLSLADDRASLLRAALEGVAFAIRDALDALLGEPLSDEPLSSEQGPPHLRLAGGGTLAVGWRQLLADVLGLPLYAVDVPAASGRGAALLGAVTAGLLSFDDIQGPLAPPARLVAEPDPAIAASHAERHARFRRIVSALQPEEGAA
jgi:xylulokinase